MQESHAKEPTIHWLTPNSIPQIQRRINGSTLSWKAPLGMLVIRTVLFVVCQALIALLFLTFGDTNAWDDSAAWWMLTATSTNLICLCLLIPLLHHEGMRYSDLLHIKRERISRDVVLFVGIMLVAVPLALIPNILAAILLFHDAATAVALLFRAIPLWAFVPLLILFPVTTALAELPTYLGYAMPRLVVLSGNVWLALGFAAFWLAAQHMALPLLFDGRFLVWRFVMYLPLAIFLAILVKWRPSLLPYLMIMHGLLDLQAALMVPRL